MASKAETLLKDYHAKRDFTKTQEPSGRQSGPGAGNRFVVQKHDATRLHFDFRIELDGVLKSWAVTVGQSCRQTPCGARRGPPPRLWQF